MTHPVYQTSAWRKDVQPAVLLRDDYECQIRGPKCSVVADRVDHIVPVEAGGAWYDFANLRASCAACNAKRARHDDRLLERVGYKPSREW